MNKLFVPFDFSDSAQNALTYAVGLARKIGASVTVFHTFEVPVPAGYEDASLTFSMALATGEREKLRQRLEDAVAPFGAATYENGQLVDFELEVRHIGLEDGVKDYLKQRPHQLIVMGTRGLQGWEEIIDETNANIVAGLANASILIVPQQATFEGIRHTVYGSNFDRNDSVIIAELQSFLSMFGGHISCVHVRTKADPGNKDFDRLEQLEMLFKDTPESEVKFEMIASDSVEQGLFGYAKDVNADLIAVMPQDHGMVGNLFHKSITKQLAHHTDMPLLIVKK